MSFKVTIEHDGKKRIGFWQLPAKRMVKFTLLNQENKTFELALPHLCFWLSRDDLHLGFACSPPAGEIVELKNLFLTPFPNTFNDFKVCLGDEVDGENPSPLDLRRIYSTGPNYRTDEGRLRRLKSLIKSFFNTRFDTSMTVNSINLICELRTFKRWHTRTKEETGLDWITKINWKKFDPVACHLTW